MVNKSFFFANPRIEQPDITVGSWSRIIVVAISNYSSQRIVNRWNSLSEDNVGVPSVNCFENRLEKRRNCQMDLFKDPWSISPNPKGCTGLNEKV